MKYFGGKQRISKQLAEAINQAIKPGQTYVEPFCGSCWVASKVNAKRKILSDIHVPLIQMWNALQNGWNPPSHVSEDLWRQGKAGQLDGPTTAFAGFGCSFSGRYYEGYARDNRGDRDYAAVARDGLFKKMEGLRSSLFLAGQYDEIALPMGTFVYCDPPYAGTKSFSGCPKFDSDKFWDWVRHMSPGRTIWVSEYNAPADFKSILSIEVGLEMRASGDRSKSVGQRALRTESVWVIK